MNLGLSLSLSGSRSSGVSYSAEATAYFAAMSVQPDATRKGHLNTLIAALKTAGVWTKLDWLAIHAAHDAQAGRVNAVDPTEIATAVNSPTFTTDRGYTGDGATSYLNSGWDPTVGTHKYLAADCHMGVWCGTDVSAGSANDLGQNRARIASRNSTLMVTNSNSASSDSFTLGSTTSVGHSLWSRDNSSTFNGFKNATNLGTATRGTDIWAGPFGICASYNTSTLVFSSFSARRIQATHWGGALTSGEITALYNALATYMTAIGA